MCGWLESRQLGSGRVPASSCQQVCGAAVNMVPDCSCQHGARPLVSVVRVFVRGTNQHKGRSP